MRSTSPSKIRRARVPARAPAYRLDLWDLADEPNGFFVECHISKHARQYDLTVRRRVQGDSPAIGRAHPKKTPALELLLGLS
jgi:hypothetical protein